MSDYSDEQRNSDFRKFLAKVLPPGVYRGARSRTRTLDPRSPKIERAKLKRERRRCKRLIEVRAGGWRRIGKWWMRTP